MIVTISAYIYSILMGIVIVFQACLAIGLPWGAASMGGKYPGKYPPKMRIIALINISVLSILILIVLIKAGLLLSQFSTFSNYAIWFAIFFALANTVLNTITKSKIERIWMPITAIQLVASIIVALN